MGAESIVELYRFNETPVTYTAVTTLIHIDEITFVKGLDATISKHDARELCDYLITKGKEQMIYKRGTRWKSVKLKKHSKFNPWFCITNSPGIVKALIC